MSRSGYTEDCDYRRARSALAAYAAAGRAIDAAKRGEMSVEQD